MTTTITKRADELKPGDITNFGTGRYIVLSLGLKPGVVYMAPLETDKGTLMWREFESSSAMKVEAPSLTPAQQHAEELLGIARRAYDGLPEQAPWKAEIGMVLAKIDPPAPPTLEEALAILSDLERHAQPRELHFDSPILERMFAILDRARRAGLKP